MKDVKKIIPDDRALLYLRGCNPFQFADRVTKLLGDCLDQINEFFKVLSTVKDGTDGTDGKDGVDGDTPYIKNGYWWIGDTNTNVPARGEKGDKGDKGDTGEKGETGATGATGPQGPQGPQGNNGVGVPPGGNVGQYLKKKSNSNYDTEWSDVQGGGSGNVNSVNNKTGDVVLSAEDVDALPSDTPLFSGDYNDLTNKPTIPAEQVQSDWNQTNNSSNDFIKNKPTIPTVPTNVSAFNNDAGYLTQHQSLSDYVQKSQTAGLIKNDGTIDTNNYLTQHQDISSKADKSEMSVVDGTGANADKTTITLKNGTSATVIKQHQDISGKQAALVSGENIKTINNESVLGSGNISAEKLVVIETPVNATDATLPVTTLVCEVGKYYRLDVAVDTFAVTLPAMTDLTTVRTVVLYLTAGTTPAVTISAADSKDVYYQDGFEIKAGSTYEINALFNGAAWVVAAVQINVE